MGPIRPIAEFQHAVENTALHRFQAVPHIGQRPFTITLIA